MPNITDALKCTLFAAAAATAYASNNTQTNTCPVGGPFSEYEPEAMEWLLQTMVNLANEYPIHKALCCCGPFLVLLWEFCHLNGDSTPAAAQVRP